jgi:hypothetical protein
MARAATCGLLDIVQREEWDCFSIPQPFPPKPMTKTQ